jgi:hypothetical protein
MSEVLCREEVVLEESRPRTDDSHQATDPVGVDSPTLARLIEEVQNEEANTANAYNRMHNRHNRSR